MEGDSNPLSQKDGTTGAGQFLQATGVSVEGRGVVLMGPSGSGKSQTALELMALGARLISDDGIWVATGPRLIRPDSAPDLIEARGIGLLSVDPLQAAPLLLAVDLERAESDRLPPRRMCEIAGYQVPVIWAKGHSALAAVLYHYLRNHRME